MSAAVAVPPFVSKELAQVRRDPEMGAAIRALEKRGDLDPLRASLAGAGMVERSRQHMDEMLDDRWSKSTVLSNVDELVVGAGLHAAIYCAVRQAEGHPRPLVLEARDVAGGAMAFGRRAGFYLNSRNRPGGLSSPGRNGALNVLPAAPVQPADLSADEFQRSIDVAYVIRMTLAMSARVRTGAKVVSVEPDYESANYNVVLSAAGALADRVIKARRVVWAGGLGEPILLGALKLITFPDLMARMDGTFPLRGLRRVAVVGAGDSGKTAIEALTGQGPRPGWSPASVDYVEKIDWYGVPDGQRSRDGWVSCARSRYRRIGGMLPQALGGESRVRPLPNASSLNTGYDMAFVNDRPYDLVVDCRGYRLDRTPLDSVGLDTKVVGTRAVATTDTREFYVVGPAAALPFTAQENQDLAANPENATALFRYAERTAALAAKLPAAAEEA